MRSMRLSPKLLVASGLCLLIACSSSSEPAPAGGGGATGAAGSGGEGCGPADTSKGSFTYTLDGETVTLGLLYGNAGVAPGNINLSYAGCKKTADGTIAYTGGVLVPTAGGAASVSTQVVGSGPDVYLGDVFNTYSAGFDVVYSCNPCGSGTITVTSTDIKAPAGTFDVMVQKHGALGSPPDPATKKATGQFDAHL